MRTFADPLAMLLCQGLCRTGSLQLRAIGGPVQTTETSKDTDGVNREVVCAVCEQIVGALCVTAAVGDCKTQRSAKETL